MTYQIHAPPMLADSERLDYARQIVRAEAAALELVADRLDDSFLQVVDLFLGCPGRIAITGTGKSADVGQKIAGTLNSTGTRAYVLDSTRAVHGDLGMVHPTDVVLALSHSGESEEIVRLLPPLRQMALALVALTSNARSTLASKADVALVYGPLEEVCPLGLAPSTSTCPGCASLPPRISPAFIRPAASEKSWSAWKRSCAKDRTCAWRPARTRCARYLPRRARDAAPGPSC